MSTFFHAVLWLDHHEARLLAFDAEQVEPHVLRASGHHSRLHGSAVRSEHEFYAEVCSTLRPIAEVLAVGSSTSLADLRRYVEKHRPALVPQIVGYETVNHPSDKQLVAMARQYFLRHDRMAGVPTPT